MKPIVALVLSAGLILTSAFASRIWKPVRKSFFTTRDAVYFVSTPIAKFSELQTPCVDVAIGDTRFVAELDLGLRADATLNRDLLEQIADKSFVKKRSMYSWQGNEYSENVYKVPQIKIGGISFHRPRIQEENKAFLQDAVFVKEGDKKPSRELGRLGWQLFYNTNLFLDFKNSRVAFSDSIETIEKQGYPVKTFAKTPLLLERGLVEFEATSGNRVVRCFLDTGATWNIFHLENHESVDQLMWDAKNVSELPSFQIGGRDFGPLTAHHLPIRLPIEVEAIIGMDFLCDKVVFIDFRNKLLYFSSF